MSHHCFGNTETALSFNLARIDQFYVITPGNDVGYKGYLGTECNVAALLTQWLVTCDVLDPTLL